MLGTDSSNIVFQRAVQFVNQTNKHIFLTGKAGTGKTTFLKFIREHSVKKMAVVAPTGVAAINAGGVTMHSFFQLPFGPYIPGSRSGWDSGDANQHSLFKNIYFNREKKELLLEMELLIIDEISMVRADMLDAIDVILRHFRQRPQEPFGGVQVLFIGDLFQLPPVVKPEEWDNLLSHYYKSPFFFDAQVIQQAPPVLISLTKIYRQNDRNFIHLLNQIRNNQASYEDLEMLHLKYKPGFEPADGDFYITLTTHNHKAQVINQQKLHRLPGLLSSFSASVTGDFSEKLFPADKELQLKVGAQIMFIKNDKGESRKFYNGKLASIARMEKDRIFVCFPGEKDYLEVERETWKNIRYRYNKEKDQIEEEELGTYKQYPIRLAWAITIHKSQGLTFERAIIDAGDSFAPGQVYVALSRLTSLEGLILYSRITPQAIHTDQRVLDFIRGEMGDELLKEELEQQRMVFVNRHLLQPFYWAQLVDTFQQILDGYIDCNIPDKAKAIAWANEVKVELDKQQEWANKFLRQLQGLIGSTEEEATLRLFNRITAAVKYFGESLDILMASVQRHIKEMKGNQRTRAYLLELRDLEGTFKRKCRQLIHAQQLAEAISQGMEPEKLVAFMEGQQKAFPEVQEERGSEMEPLRSKKGETKRLSLQLFREGKRPEEIATLRGLRMGTIETHLISFISSGEIQIESLVPSSKMERIVKVIQDNPMVTAISAIKERLDDGYSYNEIRAVLLWREWIAKK